MFLCICNGLWSKWKVFLSLEKYNRHLFNDLWGDLNLWFSETFLLLGLQLFLMIYFFLGYSAVYCHWLQPHRVQQDEVPRLGWRSGFPHLPDLHLYDPTLCCHTYCQREEEFLRIVHRSKSQMKSLTCICIDRLLTSCSLRSCLLKLSMVFWMLNLFVVHIWFIILREFHLRLIFQLVFSKVFTGIFF